MAMDARDLVRTWPSLGGLGADACLSHPAWIMPVQFGDRRGTLRAEPCDEARDALNLALTLDGEPHVLKVYDSPLFPDLHLVWAKRTVLPPEIVMALLERECAELFQFLEKTLRRQVGIAGKSDGTRRPTHAFRLETEDGALEFALDLTPELLTVFGQIDFLDPTHASIRSLTRPTWVFYGTLVITNEECAGLGPGCCVLPQGDLLAAAKWTFDLPADETVSVVSAERTPLSFAAFADDAFPEIPAPQEVSLVRRGRIFATARVTKLGDATVLRIVEMKK